MNARGLANDLMRSGNFRRPGLLMVLLCLALAALPLIGQDKKEPGKSAGFILSDEATAKEVGLPIYPGARPHKEHADDSPSVQMGLWGKSSGFKLVVLKLESDDKPEKIAAFYRKALAKYGKVLDCTNAPPVDDNANRKSSGQSSSDQLDCQADRPENGGITLKAGTKEKQHAVGIQADGNHSLFQLVYVETPKSD